MNWVRTIVAACVLTGLGAGCSKKDAPSIPANAPPPSEEKPLPAPKARNMGGGKTMAPPVQKNQ